MGKVENVSKTHFFFSKCKTQLRRLLFGQKETQKMKYRDYYTCMVYRVQIGLLGVKFDGNLSPISHHHILHVQSGFYQFFHYRIVKWPNYRIRDDTFNVKDRKFWATVGPSSMGHGLTCTQFIPTIVVFNAGKVVLSQKEIKFCQWVLSFRIIFGPPKVLYLHTTDRGD